MQVPHGSKPPQQARNPGGAPTSGRGDAVQVPATPPPQRSAWSKPLQVPSATLFLLFIYR